MLPLPKIAVFVLLCLLPCAVHSQQRSAWAFYDIKLSEIVRVGLSQLLNKSFVADDALIRDERRVSIDLKQDQAETAGPILIDLLLDAGYKVTESNGLWKIRKLTDKDKESENETLIYRPKFRSASYFYDVLGIGKNRTNSNTGQAGVSSASGVSGAGAANSQQGQTGTGQSNYNPLPDSAAQYLDRSADVVYIKGSTREIDSYTKQIAVLDQPIEQVDIAAVVYEFQTNENNATAIGAVINIAKGKLTGQIGAVQAVGDFLRLDTTNLQALFSMLAEDKRFNLISSPNIRAKSGSASRISVGASVPTLASTTATNGSVTQSVTYQQTGIILEVQPSIFEEVIDLKIKQTVSEAIPTNTGVNASPTLTTRDVSTSVAMKDGEAVVLGGLTSTKFTNNSIGLSFLPKAWRTNGETKERTELLIFLSVSKAKG